MSTGHNGLTYADAGVDIDAGNLLVEKIKPAAKATAHEIMAVTGHKTLAEVQRYTETAMREGLADSAHAKLLSRPNREQTVVNLPARFAKDSPNDLKTKGK